MKESEVLKHLDRAFTDMPSRLPDQIEMTFKRGEREMKRRYKLMTTLAVAAALAVLFAAIALAAGTLVKPRVDSVVASRGRGDGGSVRLPELTPMPTLLGKADGEATAARPTFTPPPQMMYEDDTVFYATEQGRYFHADEHCSGMMNAWPMNIDAAWISRKGPCPVCLDESAVPPIWFYYTEKGRYIHIYADCSGMKDARRATPGTLRPSDKQPCPACMPGGFALCWATPGGQYFHTERECMGMHTARIYTEVWAEWIMGKTPCPVCRLDQGNAELQ